MTEQTYLFDPKSPLVFRTGKPFDQPGDPVSLGFPLPSTLAGACRTAHGDANATDFSSEEQVADLRKIAVAGPLAAIIRANTIEPLFPRPVDTFYQRLPGKQLGVIRLQPRECESGELIDLPHKDLLPVFPKEEIKGKPANGVSWWKKEHFFTWLAGKIPTVCRPDELGWAGPERNLRTHVALDPSSLAARDSMLFQTENMDFGACCTKHGWNEERYGILARMAGENIAKQVRFCRLGGEGRVCSLVAKDQVWPVMPDMILQKLKTAGWIRMVLVTPAIFARGWQPGWLDDSLQGSPPGFPGVKLRLKSFACSRWQPVSGWDLQKKKPRAVRRMVPAGSVYWFQVEGGSETLEKLWLRPVSDDEQDRLDGFGLAAIGIWERN